MGIQTLLITGDNNHDWARSAPFCRDLMQGTGRFSVELTERPSEILANRAELSKYQLFFVDYSGPDWSDEAKMHFVDAVRGGVSVCILHAANNSFGGWREYEEICALMWRKGSSHGTYHAFDVKIADVEHAITAGMPPVLKAHPDELYHGLVHMHGAPFEVLATAESSLESGGSGKEEPVLVVKTYGKGRIFHYILGHVWSGGPMDTFESSDFQRLLLRGCEWAATGEVAPE